MTTYIHLVFSEPPAAVSEEEFDRWYNAHVQEILSVPGWVAATRYSIEGVVDPERTGIYRFLSLYELDVPPEIAIANLEAAGLGSGDSYVDLKKDGDYSDPLPLPDWFSDITFGSMNGTSRSGRITPNA